MLILADANIAYVKEAFSNLGSVRTVSANEISPASLEGVEVLLTRSTVKLGPKLLEGSSVRFVATATSGVDHVDQTWLSQRKIGFASAHGSNANSVAEWFAEVLLTHTLDTGRGPDGLTVGVVGVGAVGTKVAAKARALGATVRLCDPPLARAGGLGYEDLSSLLPECDVLTLHVPLEREGSDPTYHLIDADALGRMPRGAVLVNASRGSVVSGDALSAAVKNGMVTAILDVFEREPQIDPVHVGSASIATPHIAGHSLDAKVAGTRMIHTAACKFLGLTQSWDWHASLPAPPDVLDAATLSGPLYHRVLQAVRHFYFHGPDNDFINDVVEIEPPKRGQIFRQYRRNYPMRREFQTGVVRNATDSLAVVLEELGFCLEKPR